MLSGSVAVCLLIGLCSAPATALAGSQQLPEFNLTAIPGKPVTPTSSGGAFEMNMSTGDFSGTYISDGLDFAEQGNENGNVATYTLTEEGGSSYVATDIQHLGILPNGDIGGPSSFTDTNGNREAYTADYNNSAGTTSSSTSVSCAGAGASYLCSATVTGPGGTPTGNATFSASSGTIVGSPACALTSGSCSVTYSPPSGGLPAGTAPPVSAVYSADGTFRASQGTAPVTTSTGVACVAQFTPAGSFSCTATVTPSSVKSPLPTGTVDWSVPDAALSAEQCSVEGLTDGSASSCSIIVTPTHTGNESDLPVSADYSGDDGYAASSSDDESRGSTIPAVTLSGKPVTVDTYLDQSGSTATFTLTLSRPASFPVTVQYNTQDGSGPDGLQASQGDYEPAKGTLRFATGETTETVKVQIYAALTVRVDSGFDLLLSDPQGVAFPDTATETDLPHERPANPTPPIRQLKVLGKVDPNLTAGSIRSIQCLRSYKHGLEKASTSCGELSIRHYDKKSLDLLINWTGGFHTRASAYGGDVFVSRRGLKQIHKALLELNGNVDTAKGVHATTQQSSKSIGGTNYEVVSHEITISESGGLEIVIEMADGILGVKS